MQLLSNVSYYPYYIRFFILFSNNGICYHKVIRNEENEMQKVSKRRKEKML